MDFAARKADPEEDVVCSSAAFVELGAGDRASLGECFEAALHWVPPRALNGEQRAPEHEPGFDPGIRISKSRRVRARLGRKKLQACGLQPGLAPMRSPADSGLNPLPCASGAPLASREVDVLRPLAVPVGLQASDLVPPNQCSGAALPLWVHPVGLDVAHSAQGSAGVALGGVSPVPSAHLSRSRRVQSRRARKIAADREAVAEIGSWPPASGQFLGQSGQLHGQIASPYVWQEKEEEEEENNHEVGDAAAELLADLCALTSPYVWQEGEGKENNYEVGDAAAELVAELRALTQTFRQATVEARLRALL